MSRTFRECNYYFAFLCRNEWKTPEWKITRDKSSKKHRRCKRANNKEIRCNNKKEIINQLMEYYESI